MFMCLVCVSMCVCVCLRAYRDLRAIVPSCNGAYSFYIGKKCLSTHRAGLTKLSVVDAT